MQRLHPVRFSLPRLSCSCWWVLPAAFVAACSSSSNSGQTPGDAGPSGMSGGDGAVTTTGGDGAVSSGNPPDDGPGQCNGAPAPDAGRCPTRAPATNTIFGSVFSGAGSTLTYGTAPDAWNVYALAGPGETAPVVTPSASSLSIAATLAKPVTGQGWVSVGVSVVGARCIDETNIARGVIFTLSGDLGACTLFLDIVTSQDESVASDPCRGSCAGDAGACVANSFQVTQTGMTEVPNMSFTGGQPDLADTSQLIGFRWRLLTPDGAGCTANISISDFQLFGI